MKAIITGASSGIGHDMAILLSQQGYDLILVARSEEKLKQLQSECRTKTHIICADLSLVDECFTLYNQVKDENIDVLINNAGYGLFGRFDQTDLKSELNMIDLNVKAVHILTKLFLKDFKAKNKGYILNVASSAAFLPGPLLSCYYATKAYVLHLTEAIYEELRRENSHVSISALCPGPVDTGFNERANVKFSVKGLKSEDVAAYALKKMFARKLVIVPGIQMKFVHFSKRFVPEKLLLKITYKMQKRKDES